MAAAWPLPMDIQAIHERSQAPMPTVKPIHKLTFHDRLSRLTFDQAAKLLGEEGRKLIMHGAKYEIDVKEEVYLTGDLLRVRLRDGAVATLTLMSEAVARLHWNCNQCDTACEHVGAMFSMLLESKTQLGLAAPPPERTAVASLNEQQLVWQAVADRQERARTEKMKIKSADGSS